MRCSRPGASWARTSSTVAVCEVCPGATRDPGRRRGDAAPARIGGLALGEPASMSSEPSKARARSARSRAASGRAPYSAETRQLSSATVALADRVDRAQVGGPHGEPVQRQHPGGLGEQAGPVGHGEQQFDAERLVLRLALRLGLGVGVQGQHGPAGAGGLDGEALLLRGGVAGRRSPAGRRCRGRRRRVRPGRPARRRARCSRRPARWRARRPR